MFRLAALCFLFASEAGAATTFSYEKAPVQPVREISIDNVDVVRGKLPGWFAVHKFGENPDVGAGATEDIWQAGGLISFSSQPVRVRIADGNAADDPLGSGAATVTIQGLDANWDIYSTNLISSGATAGALSDATTHFMRVYRAFVATTGVNASYSAPAGNIGAISVVTSSGNPVIAIGAGMGQSQTSLYTTPRGYTCYLLELSASVSASKPADVSLFRRPSAWDTSGALSGSKRLIWEGGSIAGSVTQNFTNPIEIAEMTDIWARATAAAGAAASVTVDYDLACRSNSNND